MSDPGSVTLVAAEVAHIQDYIFSSNRLKENIGASFLVGAATEAWALDAVREVASTSNVSARREILPDWHIEQDSTLNAEVVYSGGGNFVAIFRSEDLARDFSRSLSTRVLLEAPGLHLILHSREHRWSDRSLAEVVRDLLLELKQARGLQPQRTELTGLSVTAMCDSSSLPAVKLYTDQDGDRRLQSAEVASKYAYVPRANDVLEAMGALDSQFRFPLDFDDLGRTDDEKSFIAVVHADGNGLGCLLSSIGQNYARIKDNSRYIDALRGFSERVKRASEEALKGTLRTLQDAIGKDGTLLHHFSGQAPLKVKRIGSQFNLPFRPLIFGGDDVTFVCDGRIGIAIALEFIRQFQAATAVQFGAPLTACAGIAIVKSHYPFARAYELAEDLCQTAKSFARGLKKDDDALTPSAIDWHFTAGGLYGELKAMRRREYPAPLGQQSLTLRPVVIDDVAHPFRRWTYVERAATGFQMGKWSGSRGKAKALMDVLRQGPQAVAAYSTRYLVDDELMLPELPGFSDGSGWDQGYCGYYDALELMDLYVPLLPWKKEIPDAQS